MAKVLEETVVIKFSKLVKSSDKSEQIVTDEIVTALEQVAQELCGNDIIAEITQE